MFWNIYSNYSIKQSVLNTGNDLVTELCPKIDFSSLFLSILPLNVTL